MAMPSLQSEEEVPSAVPSAVDPSSLEFLAVSLVVTLATTTSTSCTALDLGDFAGPSHQQIWCHVAASTESIGGGQGG